MRNSELIRKNQYLSDLRRAKRPPINGHAIAGIYFIFLLIGFLTQSLSIVATGGLIICGILYFRGQQVVRRRVQLLEAQRTLYEGEEE